MPVSKNVPMTLMWEDFLKEFFKKYMSAIYRDRKKIEFLELKQNDLSVAEYEV